MILKRILPFAHHLLEQVIKPGDIAVDATVGNGNDTKFLAELVGQNGHVYGFDIQEQAIKTTKERLIENNLKQQVTLFQTGHENLKEAIPEEHFGKIAAGIFNLGYLPKGDHSIITQPNTTLKAVEDLLNIIRINGIVILVVYHGHPGGKEEKDALLDFVTQLNQRNFQVLQYKFLNQINNPPFVIAIEKVR